MYQQIHWIKNISNKKGDAYLNVGETFTLSFPAAAGAGNVKSPQMGDLIILWQEINKKAFLTHLVTPENDAVEWHDNSDYPLNRLMRIVACAKNLEIQRDNNLWQNVYFGGISNGNFCRIRNIKSVHTNSLFPALQKETWQLFSPFLLHPENYNTADEEFLSIAGFAPEDYSANEGLPYLIQHLAYERDRRLTNLRKEYARQKGNLHCEACAFDFKTIYGQDFIECHHIIPIASSGPKENRLEDLALVCSNCHRMLHRKVDGEYLTVDNLKKLIINRQSGG